MDAANIVEVISDFMTLRKAGVNYKGLCPFHDEKTPSFVVSPVKGIYHCFGCGKGGSAVNFIMEHEQLGYADALRWLAKKYHIEVEETEISDEERQARTEREAMFLTNDWAADFFQKTLLDQEEGQTYGLSYFRSRGFRDDIMQRFRLGYAPSRRNALAEIARKEGLSLESLVQTGLCVRRDDGSLYDRFSGRVIFPWVALNGRVVAFGGRVLDARTKGVNQKYVNSPESILFHKDHELYGLYQARKAIVKEDCVFLVEGYTDVISMHECGVENVVANSGTALSMHQVRLLHRFTQNVTLLYDGDAAGVHAALRGTDMLLSEGMNLKVLLLPEGEDPDSFARKHPGEAFRSYVSAHQTDFMQFKTGLLMGEVKNDPLKRAELTRKLVESIVQIPDAIKRSVYIQECSRVMNLREDVLLREVEKRRKAAWLERKRKEEGLSPLTGQTPVDSSEDMPELAVSPTVEDTSLAASSASPIERREWLLVQAVVRYGGETLGEVAESGEKQAPTVTEYISSALQADELQLSSPLLCQMLREAQEEVDRGEFDSRRYFLNHPNPDISKLAADMMVDRYQLSRFYQTEGDAQNSAPHEDFRDTVPHLVQEYRLSYIQGEIKNVETRMRALQGEEGEAMMGLMKRLLELQTIERVLAKQAGERVVVR